MVRIVTGGVAEFDALAYQERHPGTVQFLSNQLHSLMQSGASVFTEAGAKFMAGAQQVYERVLGEDAQRRARALARSVTNAFQRDDIRPLVTLEQMQAANHRMQRFMMANPMARQMWYDGKTDGFSDTYLDMHPGQIGDYHYDYRRVMDGVTQEVVIQNEAGEGEEVTKITYYYEGELEEGDRPLDVTEVSHVQSTWEAMEARFEMGEDDPLNPFGGKL